MSDVVVTEKPAFTVPVGRYRVTAPYTPVELELPTGVEPGLTSEEWERLELQAASVVLATRSFSMGGGELRFARKALGLTQGELAGLLDVALETVSRWETGSSEVSLLVRLAVLALVERARTLGSVHAPVTLPDSVVVSLAA